MRDPLGVLAAVIVPLLGRDGYLSCLARQLRAV